MLTGITPLVITFDEAPNIGRCLEKLRWARRVIVLDSFSTDDTVAIAARFPNTEVHQRQFDDFAAQTNYALDHLSITTGWVLSLDADYILTDELIDELARTAPSDDVSAFTASFVYVVAGKPLRASLYPPRPVLFRVGSGRYVQDGHAHRLVGEGPTLNLHAPILHDDRKPFVRWLANQRLYARQEAERLRQSGARSTQDRARLLRVAPPLVLIYTLFGKGLLLEGWRGWWYALQRTIAESLLWWQLMLPEGHKKSEA